MRPLFSFSPTCCVSFSVAALEGGPALTCRTRIGGPAPHLSPRGSARPSNSSSLRLTDSAAFNHCHNHIQRILALPIAVLRTDCSKAMSLDTSESTMEVVYVAIKIATAFDLFIDTFTCSWRGLYLPSVFNCCVLPSCVLRGAVLPQLKPHVKKYISTCVLRTSKL